MLIVNGSTPTITFLMVDATDRSTAEESLDPVPVVYISKAGAAFAATDQLAGAPQGAPVARPSPCTNRCQCRALAPSGGSGPSAGGVGFEEGN